jgi:hypothetical protein
MLRKIIFVALILTVGYAVFVSSFAPKWWNASQNQWQTNVIKAQNFIFGNTDSAVNVIIGTSLSCRLIIDSLPKTYNLSFSGQSIYDGLNILVHKDKLPPKIFIEMNVALSKENKDFTSTINSPVLFYPKKNILALREDKQPMGIIGNRIHKGIMDHFILKCKYFFHLEPKKNEAENTDKNKLFEKMLQLQVEAYSKIPNEQLVNECFNTLAKYTMELERKGTTVVFFEMPVNSKLNYLPKAKIIRDTFYSRFPKSKYQYIPIPDSLSFKTTDGVHLDEHEAMTYTSYLKLKMTNHLH